MEDCSNDLANSVPEEKRADNSNDDQKYSEKNCSICNDANVDLFTCDSCANDDKSGENGDFPKFFCSWCVIKCTKVGHKIRNLKGQEPLVCSEHKIVKTEYCQTCDVPFCFKCLTDHGKHEFSSLESRANSLKTKVFEFLSEIETAEKPMRIQKDALKEKIDEHQIGQNELKNYLLEEWEQVREMLVKKIEKNCQIGSEDLAKMELLINDTVDQQRNLRRLLSMSNAHLIQNFPAVEEKFLKAQKELTEMIVNRDLKSVEISEMAKIFDHFKQEILTMMESKVECSTATNFERCFVCSDSYHFMFRVSFDGKCLEVQQFLYDDNDEIMCDLRKSVPFDNVPTKIFPVHSNSDSLRILVLSNNLEAWLIDPKSESLELKKVPYPTNSQFLWPYRVDSGYFCGLFYWTYWDESAKTIRFTHDDTFSIPCEVMPFTKMSCSDYYLLCFVIAERVVLVNVRDNSYEQIPTEDGSDISCVSTYEINRLFFWRSKDKSVQPWFKTDGKWQRACDKVYWDDVEKVYSTTGIGGKMFEFLPLIENPDDNAVTKVFAIKKVDE